MQEIVIKVPHGWTLDELRRSQHLGERPNWSMCLLRDRDGTYAHATHPTIDEVVDTVVGIAQALGA